MRVSFANSWEKGKNIILLSSGEIYFYITVVYGNWGNWDSCPTNEWVTGFAVNPFDAWDDKMGLTNVRMTCRGGQVLTSSTHPKQETWSSDHDCYEGYSKARGVFQPDQV